jgi:hypothetical protein
MTRAENGTGARDVDAGRLRQLERLLARLTEEVRQAGREDLFALLDDRPAAEASAPIRVCIVGATKVGKSRLLNALVGRPLLSPVGTTTSCWLEVGYGESDTAEVIMANADSLSHPISHPCGLDDLERYVALGRSREPVIGVQVRLRQPTLRNLLLVDTPGINGLVAGHTAATLAALRTADALLFVCDSGQPILAPERDFLVEAALRVSAVVVAVTKRDLNPEFARIVADTRERIAAKPGLGDVPVLAVAAPLADLAAETTDLRRAGQLRELSGIEPLIANLRRYSTTGVQQIRFGNAARVLAEVCRALVTRTDEIVDILAGNAEREKRLHREIDRLQAVLDDSAELAWQIRDRLDGVRRQQAASFGAAVETLRARYRAVAEWGQPSQLPTLADQLTSEVSEAAINGLESTTRECTRAVSELLDEHGGGGRWPTTATTATASFAIGLPPPDTAQAPQGADLMASAEMFAKVVEILGATVMSALGGFGVIAVGLALTAGAGRETGGREQEQRAALVGWVEQATSHARDSFRREIDDRVGKAERYVEEALPRLLDTRRRRLDQLAGELSVIRSSTADLQQSLAERKAEAAELQDVEREIDELVSWVSSAHRGEG